MKTILINAVAGCLTLFIGASVQGSYTYTTLDVPGASNTRAFDIDGSNIVGRYFDGSGPHAFNYDGNRHAIGQNPLLCYSEEDAKQLCMECLKIFFPPSSRLSLKRELGGKKF